MKELWIVMQWRGEDKPTEFQGVFESEFLAIRACIADYYYLFPAGLNEEWPQETVVGIKGGYYPRLETKEQAEKRRTEGPPKT